MRSIFTAALLLLLLPGSLIAEQRFITDDLSLDLRREPGNEFRILRMLPAGTPVTVLETQDGWSRVRADDIEGWVISRFLMDEPAARDRLAEFQARAQRLEGENAAMRREVEEIRTQFASQQDDIERLRDARDSLRQQHESFVASAAEPMRLMEENRRLLEQINELEERAYRQELDNAVLRTDVQRDWLIAGGGVLGAGLILGLILPSLLRRRQRGLRSEWM